MAVTQESMARMREAGRRREDSRKAGEMAAFERGRDDMLACVSSSTRRTTAAAVRDCQRQLRK